MVPDSLGVFKMTSFVWLTHATAARILEEIYIENKIGRFLDEEWDDDILAEVTENMKAIIDYHVSESQNPKNKK